VDDSPQPTTPQPTTAPATPDANPAWSSPQPPPAGGPPTAPTGGTMAPSTPWAPPPKSRLGRWRGLVIAVAAIAVVVLVGVGVNAFRDQLPAKAGDLQVGDCFDLPADATASSSVGDVQHHPCTESNGGEVFAVLTYPADAQATYPAPDAFDTFAADQCSTSFKAYTGQDFEAATSLDAGYFFPLDTGWSSGDRTVICYLVDAGGAPLTRSMRSPGP